MQVKTAKFIISNSDIKKCPAPNLPEYAFIGRSNVGKSSLINMLTNHKKLAKTSSTPGKTQLINHFLINDTWYLVDLPGYGYARSSKSDRRAWKKMIETYLLTRPNLMCTFLLIDSRIPLQKNDLEFMSWLATHQLPFVIVYTKSDKLSDKKLEVSLKKIRDELLQSWETLPQEFVSSAETKAAKDEILGLIDEVNVGFKSP
jgi:GTP-binding protein